jgi:hypothetical protein
MRAPQPAEIAEAETGMGIFALSSGVAVTGQMNSWWLPKDEMKRCWLSTKPLEEAKRDIGADSMTFYMRDPVWPDELRLIAMPGVQLLEPMFGFSFPPHSKRVVAEGPAEIFQRGHSFEKELREESAWPLDKIDANRRSYLVNFVEREEIRSSARLTYKLGNYIEAVLFANFVKSTTFDEALKQSSGSGCCGCAEHIAGFAQ